MALPMEERKAFLEFASKHVVEGSPKNKKRDKVIDSICSTLGEAYRPGNEEMLVHMVMNT